MALNEREVQSLLKLVSLVSEWKLTKEGVIGFPKPENKFLFYPVKAKTYAPSLYLFPSRQKPNIQSEYTRPFLFKTLIIEIRRDSVVRAYTHKAHVVFLFY